MFAGRVKIVSHSSCRASAILRYFCPLEASGSAFLMVDLYILLMKAMSLLMKGYAYLQKCILAMKSSLNQVHIEGNWAPAAHANYDLNEVDRAARPCCISQGAGFSLIDVSQYWSSWERSDSVLECLTRD